MTGSIATDTTFAERPTMHLAPSPPPKNSSRTLAAGARTAPLPGRPDGDEATPGSACPVLQRALSRSLVLLALCGVTDCYPAASLERGGGSEGPSPSSRL